MSRHAARSRVNVFGYVLALVATLLVLGVVAGVVAVVVWVGRVSAPAHPATPTVRVTVVSDCRLGPADCGYADNGLNGDK